MFEKDRSRIRLNLNFMDVIIIHEVEFKDDATAVILRGSPFLVPCLREKYKKKTFKEQDKMPAFFCTVPPLFLPKGLKNKTEYLPMFSTVPPISSPNILKKRDGMPAFF